VIRIVSSESDEWKKIKAEIETGMKLGSTCKFLVELVEFFIEKEYYYLVMEYCSKGDLEKIFKKKKHFSQSVLLFIFTYYICFFLLFYF
jgi:serine/threonine protein kinase